MKRFAQVVVLVTAVTMLGPPTRASSSQNPGTAVSKSTIDVQALGPQIGARVPDFTLRDQHGKPRTLSSLRGPKGTLLVFFRSADW